jgi:hypothetical protein
MFRKTSIGCVKLITLLFLVALGVSFGFTPVVAQDIYPREVEAGLHPNESVKIEKTVTTLEIPPLVDICLVEDETGSFDDDIANLQALAPQLVDALDASGSNYATCVIGFRDFDQMPVSGIPWGSPGDWVYKRLADVGVGGGPLLAGVGLLTAGGGADGPEAQLEALHYLADPGHAAIDSNGDGDTTDANDTAAGLQPTWPTQFPHRRASRRQVRGRLTHDHARLGFFNSHKQRTPDVLLSQVVTQLPPVNTEVMDPIPAPQPANIHASGNVVILGRNRPAALLHAVVEQLVPFRSEF